LLQESPQKIVNGKTAWSVPSIHEITSQILDWPFDKTTRQFYYDLKVRELLFQLLEISFKQSVKSYYFTPFEVSRIHNQALKDNP